MTRATILCIAGIVFQLLPLLVMAAVIVAAGRSKK
jgi:hypothetical protein